MVLPLDDGPEMPIMKALCFIVSSFLSFNFLLVLGLFVQNMSLVARKSGWSDVKAG